MEKFHIPVWFTPATVVFVDDNNTFLDRLKLGLDVKLLAPKFFDDPKAALYFLQQQNYANEFIQKFLAKSHVESAGHHRVDVDVSLIHHEIYNPKRFKQVAVIVVDYAMPGLNGVQLCEQIRLLGYPAKILMLTGEADEKIAVQAFNAGVIDQFMRKDTPEFRQEINAVIQQLHKAFFQELSASVCSTLIQSSNSAVKFCLNAPEFIQLFNEICQANNIVEYYLLNTEGSFLMLDYTGKPILLIVKSEQDMDDVYQVALNADELFAPDVLQAMQERKKILGLYDEGICDDPVEAEKFLYPAQKIQVGKTYYYAIIKNTQAYKIDAKNILSFCAYRENIAE